MMPARIRSLLWRLFGAIIKPCEKNIESTYACHQKSSKRSTGFER